jgi:aryl-alcohol dehydrogenase-like predicted oxidoreductase
MRAMWPRTLGARSIGIGDVSLATAAGRGIDRSATTRALSAALSSGLELVDISAEDDSERLVGETIRELRVRDKAIAAPRIPAISKLPSGAPTPDTLIDRLPVRYIVARVEASLRATRLDALPLAQLELRAAWRSSTAWPELVGTCARLVDEGKVLTWGALVAQVEDDTGNLALETWLTALSLPYSLCERAAEAAFAAAARASEVTLDAAAVQQQAFAAAGLDASLVIAAGLPAELVLAAATPIAASSATPKAARPEPIGLLARRPLAGGALAGTLGPGSKLRHRDDRNGIDVEQLERIAIAAAKLARFAKQVPPAARSCDAAKLQLEQNRRPDQLHAETIGELALRFVVSRGVIALPRLHRHELVIDALAASILPPLPPDLIEALEQLDI